MTPDNSLPSPRFIQVSALASGLLSATSLLVSLWVYWRWNYPAEFIHTGKSSWTESAGSYVFTFPAFQVVLSLALAWQAVRWRTFFRAIVRKQIELKARDEGFSQLDPFSLLRVVCCLIVAVNAVLLMWTVYRIWMLVSDV